MVAERLAVEVEGSEVEGVRAHLDDVLGSRPFSASPRLRSFLRYVVEKALAGEGHEIKEYLVATEVYQRDPSYDPQIDSTVRVEASRLRGKLRDYYRGEGQGAPLEIELPKGSYAPVFHVRAQAPVPQDTPPAVMAELVEAAGEAPVDMGGRPLAWRRLVVLLLALGLLVGLTLAVSPGPGRPAPPKRIASIAVLPLVDLSADADTGLLAEGLTEALTARLARLEEVRVPARTTMAQFKDKAVNVVEVGRHTRTDAVLEGSVRRSQSRVLVSVQLIDASDGYHLWAETFEEDGKDLRALEERLSGCITRALSDRVRERTPWRSAGRAIDPETVNLHLRAEQLLRKPVLQHGWPAAVPPNVTEAIRLLEDVTRRSPQYARAWVGLAEATEWAYELDPAHPRARLDAARASLERALALDPVLPEAYSRLASLYLYGYGDRAKAHGLVRRAIELNPRDVGSQAREAQLLRIAGRTEEALQEVSRALTLEPAASKLWTQRALLLYDLDRYGEAIEAAEHALAVDSGGHASQHAMAVWIKGLSLERQGDVRAAETEFRRGLSATAQDEWNQPSLGHLLARTGRVQEARRVLQDLVGQESRGRHASYAIALVHAGLGEQDEALRWLERGQARGDTSMPFVHLEKRFGHLRGLPRFDRMARVQA